MSTVTRPADQARSKSRQVDDWRISVFESELGWMAAAWVSSRLARLTFGHRTPTSAHRALDGIDVPPTDPTSWMKRSMRRIQKYAAGQPDDFLDIELDLSAATPFQRKVVENCRRIPFGHTLSYGELAAKAGHPRAARAVGNTMANNRIPLIIPCHRVVGSAGSLGGYSAPDGLDMKRRLLRLEGAL